MDTLSFRWNEILEEMLPRNECDICTPPLEIGPPPPVPASFRDSAILSGNCNVCNTVNEVEIRPLQVTDSSFLPVAATFMVGILLVIVSLIFLLFKIKKCRSFVPHAFCWIFPRSVLPHRELATSSLPSPTPSMEKLKDSDGKQKWNTSSRSLQSENIYEVCSPPSPDSLYEEVGPVPRSECAPYGVVIVENSLGRNFVPKSCYNSAMAHDNVAASHLQPYLLRNITLQNSRFSTFGGNAHGFVNPVVRDINSHTLHSSFRPKLGNKPEEYVQKRELPPVPGNRNYPM